MSSLNQSSSPTQSPSQLHCCVALSMGHCAVMMKLSIMVLMITCMMMRRTGEAEQGDMAVWLADLSQAGG